MAVAFDEMVRKSFTENEPELLLHAKNDEMLFKMNHPTPDHFIPLLYLAGVRNANDEVEFPHMSWQYGTFSMRHILLK